MSYLYETHLHTCFSSACANSKGSEYIRLYKELGYSGIVVTDHFYNGNTAVPRSLPWKEWVNQFCKGYEEARNEGERQGFDVFFGWEETFDNCDDYLVYGLDKEWLLEHPEAKNWTRAQQYHAVKAAGGCVIQSHPFRQHSYISRIVLSSGCVDAVETANAGNLEQSYDALAMRYALKLGLPFTAGSDTHDSRQITGDGVFGIYVKEKIKTIGELANVICTNGIAGIKITEGRCDYYGDETVVLPVVVRDKNDHITNKNWKDFI
jgi:predicted metal-dependent phosphoesterase TrpH